MRRILELGLRGAAAIVVLFGVVACGTGAGDGDGDGGGGGGGTDAAPTVSISSPSEGASFASGASIDFAGTASDAEDGDLTSGLAWTSDLDGAIGSGGSFSAQLSDGTHLVAASATDSASQTASDTVTIAVGDDGGGGGGGGTDGVRDVGFVVVEESTSAASDSGVASNGGFARFDGDVPDAFFTDPWADIVGTCDVFSAGDIPDDPTFGLPTPDGLGITFLEAGASLSVTADGAAFLELDRDEQSFRGQTVIFYSSGEDVAGTADGALALMVPGDEFPAVIDAAFPPSSTFELTAPATPGAFGSVDEATTFTWTGASNDDATIVAIELITADFTSVSCTAPDTGTFELPAETIAELGGSFSGRVTAAGRESVRVEALGDARLLLSVSRSQEFAIPVP